MCKKDPPKHLTSPTRSSVAKSKQVSTQRIQSIYPSRLLSHRLATFNTKVKIDFFEQIRLKHLAEAKNSYKELLVLKNLLTEESPKNAEKEKPSEFLAQTSKESLNAQKLTKGIVFSYKFFNYFKSIKIKLVPYALIYFSIVFTKDKFRLRIIKDLYKNIKEVKTHLFSNQESTESLYILFNDSFVINKIKKSNHDEEGSENDAIIVEGNNKIWTEIQKALNRTRNKKGNRINDKEVQFLQKVIKEKVYNQNRRPSNNTNNSKDYGNIEIGKCIDIQDKRCGDLETNGYLSSRNYEKEIVVYFDKG